MNRLMILIIVGQPRHLTIHGQHWRTRMYAYYRPPSSFLQKDIVPKGELTEHS